MVWNQLGKLKHLTSPFSLLSSPTLSKPQWLISHETWLGIYNACHLAKWLIDWLIDWLISCTRPVKERQKLVSELCMGRNKTECTWQAWESRDSDRFSSQTSTIMHWKFCVGDIKFSSVYREGKFYVVSQLTQNFPSISKSMLHSMEGKFYVGSLEVHKPSPSPNPSPNHNPNPSPNPSPSPTLALTLTMCLTGRGRGGGIKISPP